MNSNSMNEKIKKENRKALKIFIPMIIAAGLIGGVFGFFSQTEWMQNFFADFGGNLDKAVYLTIPYLVIVTVVVTFLTGLMYYRKAKKDYKGFEDLERSVTSDEDEEKLDLIYQKADCTLSISLIIINIGMLFSYMFFGIFMNYLIPLLDAWKFGIVIITIAVFLTGMFAGFKIQQMSVDLVKRMNPKMRGSVYDMKFSKKWEESCDEAEKLMIYKASYKAFQIANLTCTILWILTCLGDMLLHFGALPVVTVSVIWIVMSASYYIESFRLEHGKHSK